MIQSPANLSKNDLRIRALVTFVKEAFFQLDELAYLKKKGHKANISAALFREMCSVIKEFEPELLEKYYEIITDLSICAELQTRRDFTEEFALAESKSRKKFIERMRDELTKAA